MTAFLIFLGVWSLVALAISLLLGSHLGRRRRPAIDPLGSATPRPVEGDAHPGDEIRGGQPASHPRQGVPLLTRNYSEHHFTLDDSGRKPFLIGQRQGDDPRQAAPRRDVPNRWRMVLELVAIEPCRFEKDGSACRLLDYSARDLWWCPPCLAYDALDRP
jgi:hypothetical protein